MNSRSSWALALLGVIAALVVALRSIRDDRSREEDGGAATKVATPPGAEGPRSSDHGPRSVGVTTAAAGERIRGRITDSESGPLSEGRLDVYCLDSLYQSTTTVGEEGEFEVGACASGPSCLRLTHPGAEQPRAWEIEPGSEVELETEPAARVRGTIRSTAGEAVAGASLLVQLGARQLTGSSDVDGEYAVALVRARPCDRCDPQADAERACRDHAEDAGAATMLITAKGFAPLSLEFPVSGEFALDVVLQPPGPALRGRVLGSAGEPFDERTRVLAHDRERERDRHAASVDADGLFAFEDLAEDREYVLRAIRDEREIATLALARPGERVELRAEIPARGAALIVEIVDAESDPIVGARIDGGPFRAAISDVAGRVEANDVLPGRYTVRVRRQDCAVIRETIELEPPDEPPAAWVRRLQLPENC